MSKIRVLTLSALVVALGACSHAAVEQRLDQKLAQETDVKSRADLQAESDRLIETTSWLSSRQRRELQDLRDSSRKKSDELRATSNRLREVLVKSVLAQDYQDAEVEEVKKKIVDIEHQRLDLFYSSVHQLNNILGRWESSRERESDDLFNHMLEIELYRI